MSKSSEAFDKLVDSLALHYDTSIYRSLQLAEYIDDYVQVLIAEHTRDHVHMPIDNDY